MTQYLNLYDNETVKWEHDGKRYCLHIQCDETPSDPRGWGDQLDIMACWHGRYSLGDDIPDREPEEFWQRLVRENVTEEDVLRAARAGKLYGIRLAENEESATLVDVYETCCWRTVLGTSEPEEVLAYEGVLPDAILECLIDDLTVAHCITLMEPYARWLPLWLYDHSGITMSCGTRTYPYNDEWDSGQVGWIVTLKKTILENFPLAEETWQEKADEIMRSNVEEYDRYLTGDVYGYTLYESDSAEEDQEWEEIDSCWGFFGSDILENGIVGNIGFGLSEALDADAYECGQATLHHSTWYTF